MSSCSKCLTPVNSFRSVPIQVQRNLELTIPRIPKTILYPDTSVRIYRYLFYKIQLNLELKVPLTLSLNEDTLIWGNGLFYKIQAIEFAFFILKLLEKMAANQIMKNLNKFKLLYEHQFGFRAKHNTTQPLIHFLDKIYNNFYRFN